MAVRTVPLINDQVYHIFNRSLERKPIFSCIRDNERVLTTLSFYRFANIPVKLSYFLTWSAERRIQLLDNLEKENKVIIRVLCFSLMPNHFHLLLRQVSDGGISTYLGLLQNSFTKYFNTKRKRKGHLFEGQFKAVRIETEEQLLHVSRYIHLNPYTSFVVKNLEDLSSYPWSSLPSYLGKARGFVTTEDILSSFKNTEAYKEFVFGQADYQRTLESIKHLVLED